MGRSAGSRSVAASETGREAIVFAAADCFMETGYTATSIDDVADRLNATKGRVYHYYRSKAELFFDVHRRGMEINLAAIEPIAMRSGDAAARLGEMCRTHLRVMLEYLNFQRVVMQGVEMHLAGSTTPSERRQLALLMQERERYEGLFRKVLVEGRSQGRFAFSSASFASKAVLAIVNNPVLWYRRRDEENEGSRQSIIDEFTVFALGCVTASQ